MLRNSLQCTGEPPQQGIVQLRVSFVPLVGDSAWSDSYQLCFTYSLRNFKIHMYVFFTMFYKNSNSLSIFLPTGNLLFFT